MANFRVHRVRFFEYQPEAIHCLAYNCISERLALSRADGSIEIWSIKDNWYQEKVIVAGVSDSTEAIIWCGDRLFSASLNAQVIEYNLQELRKERHASSNSGAVWCLTKNSTNSHLAAGTEDGCLVLFDITNNDLQYDRAFDKQEGRILTVAWHKSEDVIVTGGVDNIRLWSVKAGHAIQRLTVPRQHRNKETIVWSVLFLETSFQYTDTIVSDMTIVSGDSRGKTCFWNGKQGTLIKSYKSHKADVLVVCANELGDTVISGGIDPQVIQFKLTHTHEGGAKEWVPSRSHNYHTHDIRTMAWVNKQLVSGGIDTMMISCQVKEKLSQKYLKFPAIPHTAVLHVAATAHIVLFNYRLYLELWQLGDTNQSSLKNGEILPLNAQPIKLLRLNTRSGASIVCSAISHDARLIAYCDQASIKVYRLDIDRSQQAPNVSLFKLKIMSTHRPAHKLLFSPNSHLLLSLCDNGDLVLFSIVSDMVQLMDSSGPLTSPHLITISPNGHHVAVGSHNNSVHIYNIEKDCKLHYHGSLPQYGCQPTAMAFSPKSFKLLVTYTDRKILEYNVKNLHFTDWCRRTVSNYHPDWLSAHRPLSHVAYCCNNSNLIIVHDSEMFCLLNKKQKFPDPLTRSSLLDHKDGAENAFHICDKYKYIMMAESLSDDWLMVVERPPIAIIHALPPSLELKKYGT